MNESTFDQLIAEHKDAIYRQMLRVCAHREDAEDALASAIVLAYRSSSDLASEKSFRPWLGTIARRVCLSMRGRPDLESLVEENQIADSTDNFDRQLMKSCVKSALDGLRPIYREVYEACELEEKTVPEVAKALNLSEAAVKSRLLRARQEVRESLDHSICGR